jgi:hypothetical protein
MSLAYERAGSGPSLVLLHGLGHRRQGWAARYVTSSRRTAM